MTSVVFTKTEINIALGDERSDRCEHVEAGEEPFVLHKEDDSFGPVLRNVTCKACYDKHKEYEKTQFAPCEGCNASTPYSQLSQWRPYDGGPGDERDLCRECRGKASRAERKEIDALNGEDEGGD